MQWNSSKLYYCADFITAPMDYVAAITIHTIMSARCSGAECLLWKNVWPDFHYSLLLQPNFHIRLQSYKTNRILVLRVEQKPFRKNHHRTATCETRTRQLTFQSLIIFSNVNAWLHGINLYMDNHRKDVLLAEWIFFCISLVCRDLRDFVVLFF